MSIRCTKANNEDLTCVLELCIMALYPLSTKCYKDNLLLLFDETEEDKNKTKIFLQSSGNGVYY